MAKVPLSVVVITKNEERNIEDCLNSVYGWASEIVVVDDQSTDKTILDVTLFIFCDDYNRKRHLCH